jgi:hypothetical protein
MNSVLKFNVTLLFLFLMPICRAQAGWEFSKIEDDFGGKTEFLISTKYESYQFNFVCTEANWISLRFELITMSPFVKNEEISWLPMDFVTTGKDIVHANLVPDLSSSGSMMFRTSKADGRSPYGIAELFKVSKNYVSMRINTTNASFRVPADGFGIAYDKLSKICELNER